MPEARGLDLHLLLLLLRFRMHSLFALSPLPRTLLLLWTLMLLRTPLLQIWTLMLLRLLEAQLSANFPRRPLFRRPRSPPGQPLAQERVCIARPIFLPPDRRGLRFPSDCPVYATGTQGHHCSSSSAIRPSPTTATAHGPGCPPSSHPPDTETFSHPCPGSAPSDNFCYPCSGSAPSAPFYYHPYSISASCTTLTCSCSGVVLIATPSTISEELPRRLGGQSAPRWQICGIYLALPSRHRRPCRLPSRASASTVLREFLDAFVVRFVWDTVRVSAKEKEKKKTNKNEQKHGCCSRGYSSVTGLGVICLCSPVPAP